MKKQEIAQSLRRSVQSSTPDVLDQVWQKLDAGAQPALHLMEPQQAPAPTAHKHPALRRTVYALAACLILLTGLLIGSYASTNFKVESVVGLDVNPSIELSTNAKNQVIDYHASNEDGRQILGDMNLKKVDLQVAVNAIIGSMFQQGYLKADSIDNTILVTVLNSDQNKAAQLQQELTGSINGILSQNNAQARVICRQDADSDDLRQLAQQYGISLSKADLIRDLMKMDSSLDPEALAKKSIKDLAELLDDLEDKLEDQEEDKEDDPDPDEKPGHKDEDPEENDDEDEQDDSDDKGNGQGHRHGAKDDDDDDDDENDEDDDD